MKKLNSTKFLKFPFQFEEDKLVHDLSLATNRKWFPHFNTKAYDGEWKIIPLYAINGDESDMMGVSYGNVLMQETPLMKDCIYFKEVIDSLKFTILSARIMRLGAGADIKPHQDHALGYEDGDFRLHIPITTNEKVEFVLDGTILKMKPGECWYTNVNYVHSVSNAGTTDRNHLVIDGRRNEWTDKLFFSLAPEETFRPIPKKPESPETIKQIIEELKRNNQPAAMDLIDEYQKKLDAVKENK
jgi:aspartyl/asparaginyl beta-hydroxylase